MEKDVGYGTETEKEVGTFLEKAHDGLNPLKALDLLRRRSTNWLESYNFELLCAGGQEFMTFIGCCANSDFC